MSEAPPKSRLTALQNTEENKSTNNAAHSSLIHWLKIILPVSALCIIAVVFSWNGFQNNRIEPIKPKESPQVQTIGTNELLNPHFENLDDKNQPYAITAERALQGDSDNPLVILEEPFADLLMNDGHWVAAKSQQAAYRQDSERLLLKGDVQLFYDEGYTLRTEELDVDMAQGLAQTDLKTQISGPMGLLDSQGLEGKTQEETLIFKGPAKLVLYVQDDTLNIHNGAAP